jgi:hypothetical protein
MFFSRSKRSSAVAKYARQLSQTLDHHAPCNPRSAATQAAAACCYRHPSHRHGVTQQAPALLLLLVRGFVPGFLYHISTVEFQFRHRVGVLELFVRCFPFSAPKVSNQPDLRSFNSTYNDATVFSNLAAYIYMSCAEH